MHHQLFTRTWSALLSRAVVHRSGMILYPLSVSILLIGACDCGTRASRMPRQDASTTLDAGTSPDVAIAENNNTACGDGVDNDGDGLIDCLDIECIVTSPCTDAGPPVDLCKVRDGMDAVGECKERAPPDSFEPEVQWVWNGQGEEQFSIVTPLVGNLTDDDGNGEIDLCDTPDVVVVAAANAGPVNTPGHIYLLDGETGTLHFRVETPVDSSVTPAIGDIDGDGLMEIVTTLVGGHLVAFEHDGTLKWEGGGPWVADASEAPYGGAIALADMDNDGDVEIIAGNLVADHNGTVLFVAPVRSGAWSASTAADLDGDGDLELVLGHAAYHHDGTEAYVARGVSPGYPQVADLDGDGLPEVLVTNRDGISVIEHDGTVKYGPIRPTDEPGTGTRWLRPATIHDFDGDGSPEFAVSSGNNYVVYEADGTILWSAVVSDQSGIAAGTAFDFLGDGIAEAMYADENNLFIFDGEGGVLLSTPRTSGTLTEYPVVADVDDDGSAEIIVVSSRYMGEPSPTVQVIRDVDDRWIQARRIWNQHAYHVTNVREDGTIPRMQPSSWLSLNTFRTNAQIEGGALCMPELI